MELELLQSFLQLVHLLEHLQLGDTIELIQAPIVAQLTRHAMALSAQPAAFGAIFHHTLSKCVYTMQVSVWGPKKSVWGLEKKCVGGVKNVWGP